jgi:ketosteroid isomerase-like protein
MTQPVPRQVVEDFYCALSARDFDKVAQYLDDDIHWTISGPVDVLPFCGHRRGKQVVLDLLARDIPTFLVQRRFLPTCMLVDGDRAAILGRLMATLQSGRSISYRITHFLHFRNNKIIEYDSIFDTFDAVEQVIGHSLVDGSPEPDRSANVVAV